MIAAVSNKKQRCLRLRKILMICATKGSPFIGSMKSVSKCLRKYLITHKKMKLYARKQKMLYFSIKYMSISIIKRRKAKRSMAFTQPNSKVHITKNLCRSRHLINICQWIKNIRNVLTSVFRMTRLWKVHKNQEGPKTSCNTYRQKSRSYLNELKLASFPGNCRALLVKKSLLETKRSSPR